MENFRELEKEYKQKKLTKVAYQNHNEIESKFMFDSGEDDDDADYGDSDLSDLSDEESEAQKDASPLQMDQEEDVPVLDKAQFICFMQNKMKELQTKHETEIDSIRNMKKGSVKKNKVRNSFLMGRIQALK